MSDVSPKPVVPGPVLVRQASTEPTRKVSAAINAGAVATALSALVTWGLGTYTKVDLPAPVQVAVATLFTAGIAYVTHERAMGVVS